MPYVRRRGRLLGRRRRVGRYGRPIFRRRRFPYRTFRRGRSMGRGYKRRRLTARTLRVGTDASVSIRRPISTVLWTKFRYANAFALNCATVNTDYYKHYNMNWPGQPDASVAADYCSGWTQLMTIYRDCLVFGFKIFARFMTYTGQMCYCYILFDDHSHYLTTATLNRNFFAEDREHTIVKLACINGSSGWRPTVIRAYRSIKRIEQQRDLELESYVAQRSNAPSLIPRAQVGAMQLGSGASPGPQVLNVYLEIVYYCKLFNRIAVVE